MAALENEQGEPRYGARLSPEELEAYLQEQQVRPTSRPAAERAPGEAGPRRAAALGAPVRPRHRWRLLVLGLVLLLVVPFVLLIGTVASIVEGGITEGTVLGADGQVYLDDAQTVGLYSTAVSEMSCTVTGPDGATVETTTVAPGAPYLQLTASGAGTYTIACEGGTEGMVAGPAIRVDRLPLAEVLVVGAFLSGLVGLVLSIVGLVRALRRS